MPEKQSILYFYTAESPFVEKDIEILSERYKVQRFRFELYKKNTLFISLFNQAFFLFYGLFRARMVVCQFAGMHAYLPILFSKLFFRKSVIVAGGTDCVSFPSINYGNFANKRNRYFTAFCFRQASLILPVHESLVLYDYTYQPNDFPKQGIKYFLPGLKTKIITIYNGYDHQYWHNTVSLKEEHSFITVLGHLNSRFTIQLKGIDLFIEMARKFPSATFTIVGGSGISGDGLPSNLTLLSNIWGEKLVDVFSSKKYYVQLSMSEGFPNALSEAMLCECIPIVSAVGGMPDIVGDTGFILKRKDISALSTLIEKALAISDSAAGIKARRRIAENFTFDRRKTAILAAIGALLEKK